MVQVTRGDALDLAHTRCLNLAIVVCTHAFTGAVRGVPSLREVAIFDAAEPKGGTHLFNELRFALLSNGSSDAVLNWFGVGYARHPGLYVPVRRFLGLPRRVIFGCFAEALSLSRWMRSGEQLERRVVETGSGHECIIGRFLECDAWQPHAYLIASHGI